VRQLISANVLSQRSGDGDGGDNNNDGDGDGGDKYNLKIFNPGYSSDKCTQCKYTQCNP